MSDATKTRLLYIDWLRGLAVLCMFEAHVFSSWLRPELMSTQAFAWANVIAGYAAPLFLFLTGVGMAMSFESALGRGTSREEARRAARSRGLQIFVAALVFRVQEHVLGGGPVANLLRVDILNCIGLSMIFCTVIAFPPAKGALAWRTAATALVVALLSPLAGKIAWPGWVPEFLGSYISDGRSWFFPLFPWLAYPFAGLFAGTAWARGARSAGGAPRTMALTFLVGLFLIGGSWYALGLPAPKFLFFGGKWRNLPTYVLTHVGWICVLAAIFWVAQSRFNPARFGPLRQLGRTSLLMYWVHVDLVYGHLPGEHALNLKGRLGFTGVLVGLGVLSVLMLALSWARTRYLGAFRPGVVFTRLWWDFVAQLREAWRKSAQRSGRAPRIAAVPAESSASASASASAPAASPELVSAAPSASSADEADPPRRRASAD